MQEKEMEMNDGKNGCVVFLNEVMQSDFTFNWLKRFFPPFRFGQCVVCSHIFVLLPHLSLFFSSFFLYFFPFHFFLATNT